MIELIALAASLILNAVLISAILISHKTGVDPKPLAEKDLQAIETAIKAKFDELVASFKGDKPAAK